MVAKIGGRRGMAEGTEAVLRRRWREGAGGEGRGTG
uniref:Uncharacterized protein MANES_12G132200 n=1 Tax=Rhizophora mucronata TaxID=61149 RepID=A0A2P2J2K1_RHIMU